MTRTSTTLAVAALFLLPLSAIAAEPADEHVPLQQGTGALMFNLGGLFSSTPSALDGIGVGGRYFLSDSMALRAALGLNMGSVENKFGSTSSEIKTSYFGVEGGAEITLMHRKNVYIYTGGILQVGMGGSEPDEGPDDSSFGLTLAGLLGANWFFTQAVSIGAEYRLGVSQISEESKPSGGGTKTERTTMNIGTGTVGFHLAFWFY